MNILIWPLVKLTIMIWHVIKWTIFIWWLNLCLKFMEVDYNMLVQNHVHYNMLSKKSVVMYYWWVVVLIIYWWNLCLQKCVKRFKTYLKYWWIFIFFALQEITTFFNKEFQFKKPLIWFFAPMSYLTKMPFWISHFGLDHSD